MVTVSRPDFYLRKRLNHSQELNMNLLTKLFGQGQRHRAAGKSPRSSRQFVPEIESLQERLMPAVLVNGNLHIIGNNSADTVTVTLQNGTYQVIQNGRIE